jgi:predicted ATPase
MPNSEVIKIDRLRIENYRSIRSCDFTLGDVTFLVGRNGAGKTNLLDALAFLQRGVNSLETAFEDRVSARSLVNRSAGLPAQIRFFLEFSDTVSRGEYSVAIEVRADGTFEIAEESGRISGKEPGRFSVLRGLVTDIEPRPGGLIAPRTPVLNDRLLSAIVLSPMFNPLRNLLRSFAFLEPATREMKVLAGPGLQTNSLAGRVKLLHKYTEDSGGSVYGYLRAIFPGFDRLEIEEGESGPRVVFVERDDGGREMRFRVNEVSAGVVSAAELLINLFTPSHEWTYAGSVYAPVCIEDPEAGMHPFASAVMRDAIRHASTIRQVIVTTHSTELLDDKDVRPEEIRVVHRDDAGTHVDPLDEEAASVLREHLMTAGELLRSGGMGPQLNPHLSGA